MPSFISRSCRIGTIPKILNAMPFLFAARLHHPHYHSIATHSCSRCSMLMPICLTWLQYSFKVRLHNKSLYTSNAARIGFVLCSLLLDSGLTFRWIGPGQREVYG
jgi:hypothetical protein